MIDNMGVARSSVGQCNWKVVAKINKGGKGLCKGSQEAKKKEEKGAYVKDPMKIFVCV